MLIRLSIFFSVFISLGCVLSLKATKYKTKLKEGNKCDLQDFGNYPVEGEISHYLYCDWWSGRLIKSRCPVVDRVQKVFDKSAERCLFPNSFLQHAAGSSRVGDTCTFNTDCLDGMFCGNGVCVCLSTYVERDYYCYLKINPSQSGCQYHEQCRVTWPGSSCSASNTNNGVCNCPTGTVAIETRDGFVCTNSKTASCPLPVAMNPAQPADVSLKYDGTTDKATCTYGSTQSAVGQTCFSAATNGYSVAELFECVPDGTKNPLDPAQTLCCPNRAYTCIQPQVSAEASAANAADTTTRWWYNAVTGTCEQFLWVAPGASGNPANSNNFETLSHCQTYCGNTCSRGNPEYSLQSGAATFQSRKPLTCTSASGCDSDHECTTIGSFQKCCPTYDFVCSQAGGLNNLPTGLSTQYNPGIAPSPPNTVQRWFYDATTSRCRTFQYLGVAGNFNNFATQSDCQSYCRELLCDKGSPISDGSGNYQSCSGNSGCPSTYECNNNVCCPRAQTVCAEPKQIGTCNERVRSYWYNAVTRECEQFDYSGCQGNDNRFESLTACNTYCRNTKPQPVCIQGEAYKDSNGNYFQCSNTGQGNVCPANYECYYDGFVYGCCPIKSYTCSLTSSQGAPCGVATSRWYYDTTNQVCQTFSYLGCDGNSNNFPNRELCESYCGVGGCPFGGDPYREQDGSLRICNSGITCPSTHECQKVTLSSNSVINYCCPSRSYVCSLPPAATQTCARSSASITRYYHNFATKSCVAFEYYGCARNENNYATKSQCKNFCDSAGCELGEAAYIDPTTNNAITCNPSITNTCPNGYTCRHNSITGKNICCGATNMGVCPSGEKAFIDPYTLEARECTPNIAGTCPSTFLCRFRTQNSKYYCCQSTTLCPAGRQVYRDPNNDQPQICVLGSVINPCPSHHSCQNSADASAFQGYCCTVEDICPHNGIFEHDPKKPGIAKTCTLGSSTNVCQPGYLCMRPDQNVIEVGRTRSFGYCCTPGTLNVCGNTNAYVIDNHPVSCKTSEPTPCPLGYKCQSYPVTGESFCCSRGIGGGTGIGTIGNGCPPGQVALLINGNQPQSCSLQQQNSCPIGYVCQWSSSVNRFQCCGTSGGCPFNSVASIDSYSGGPQTCGGFGYGICPTGFSCQKGTNGQQVCCTSTGLTPSISVNPVIPTGLCPIPGQSLAPGYQNSGLTCSAGLLNSCPSGYSCQYSPTGRYICCGSPGGANTGAGQACPPGSNVAIDPYQRIPQVCSGQTGYCSPGYQCTYSLILRQYYCCTPTIGSVNPGSFQTYRACDRGTEYLYPGMNSPLICTYLKGNCPAGYTCSYSYLHNADICCSSFKKKKGKKPNAGNSTEQISPDSSTSPVNSNSIEHGQTASNGPCHGSKDMGEECCSDNQCDHQCGNFNAKKLCLCPIHLLLDLTYAGRKRCVSSCPKWRNGPFCMSSPPSEQQQPFSNDFSNVASNNQQTQGNNFQTSQFSQNQRSQNDFHPL